MMTFGGYSRKGKTIKMEIRQVVYEWLKAG